MLRCELFDKMYHNNSDQIEFETLQKGATHVHLEKISTIRYNKFLFAQIGFETTENEPPNVYSEICSFPYFEMQIS